MNDGQNTLNKLITLSQYYRLTKAQRKANNINIHHVNIIIAIYILQEYQGNKGILFNHIVEIFNYFDNKRLKQIIGNIIPEYINRVQGKYYNYYSLTDKGICVVRDILDNYDTVYRAFLEKHKLNEVF